MIGNNMYKGAKKQQQIFLFGNCGWLSKEPMDSEESPNASLGEDVVVAFRARVLILRLKVVVTTCELFVIVLEGIYFFTL